MSEENKFKDKLEEENETPSNPEPKNERMKWYVVHTHSGMENKAKKSLQERIVQYGFQDYFGEILLPTETVEHVKNNVRRVQSRKCLPGYMIVEMELTNDTSQIVRGTPKIAGFVGGSKMPMPISKDEAERMMQLSKGVKKTIVSMEFSEGENVKVIDGPFANFQGTIDEVKPDKSKLRVFVSIFGRSTPVELDFNQVEKIN
jgi:transcription termination/antitermination protein NusG